MKGLLFCEFLEFLENQIGEDNAQEIIDSAELASEGAYSRVGFYDYQELIELLVKTAAYTQKDTEILLQGFADHLFDVFHRDYDVFFANTSSAADMLKTIDDHIHVEVKKLYPDAELPKFRYEEYEGELHLYYQSPRPLAAVAHSLVLACLKFYKHSQKLQRFEISEDQKSAIFVIVDDV